MVGAEGQKIDVHVKGKSYGVWKRILALPIFLVCGACTEGKEKKKKEKK